MSIQEHHIGEEGAGKQARPEKAAYSVVAGAALLLGIVGFLMSFLIIGVFVTVVAAIFGHSALANIRNSRGRLRGSGLAKSGLILSYTGIVVSLAVAGVLMFAVYKQGNRKVLLANDKDTSIRELKHFSPKKVESEVMSLLDAGKQTEAEELLRALPPSLQRDLRLTFLSGVLARSRWSKFGAQFFFTRVREVDPDSKEGRAAKLVMEIDKGAYYDEYLKELLALADDSPDDMMITWLYAMSCREYFKRTESTKYSGSGIKAYEKLDEYWDVGPSLFHQTYANVLRELDRHSEAVVHYQKAVELEPSSWAYDGLIKTLRHLERYDEAIEACRAALMIDPYDDDAINEWGLTLERQKKYQEAAEKYEEGLALGNHWSYHNLGLFYRDGLGVPKDPEKAIKLLEKSAELGNAKALRSLGNLYRDGTGVTADRQKAEEYYLKSADQGNNTALTALGYMYDVGRAGPKDKAKALEYYLLAERAGDDYGAWNAALLYYHGRGIKQDRTKSMRLFLRAAELNHHDKDLPGYIAEHYDKGWGVKPDISKAIEWWEKGVQFNNEYCVFKLGQCYVDGIGVERDIQHALQIYRKAADAGVQSAVNSLNKMPAEYVVEYQKAAEQDPAAWNYRVLANALFALERYDECIETCKAALEKYPKDGEIANTWGLCLERQKKYEEAFAKYEEGAALGNNWSQHNLGYCYLNGSGVEKDLTKAKAFYEKSADKGNARAMDTLATMYRDALGMPADRQKAEELYLKAAKLGYRSSLCHLGYMYDLGIAGPGDKQKALKYYLRGEKEGDSTSAWNAALLYYHGNGTETNHTKSLQLFLRAAELKYEDKGLPGFIAKQYEDGLGVKSDISKAVEWWQKGVSLNDAYCIDKLGQCYENGIGVERDIGHALQIYRKAADEGIECGINKLARLRAASPFSEYLDGEESLKYALKLPQKSYYRETLGAAYARNGQFKEAAKAQREAITLLEQEKADQWKHDPTLRQKEIKPYEERLALFESGKAYQEPPTEHDQ